MSEAISHAATAASSIIPGSVSRASGRTSMGETMYTSATAIIARRPRPSPSYWPFTVSRTRPGREATRWPKLSGPSDMAAVAATV